MILEVLFSGVLILFFGYCIINATQTLPADVAGELSAKQWSVAILVLIILFLIINIINVIRKTPKEQRSFAYTFRNFSIQSILKSRLIWAIISMLAYAALVDVLGFLITTLIFCTVFCMLLGEKKLWKAAVFSLAATVILYFVFYKGMSIILPRGSSTLFGGFFRTFSRTIEKFVRNLF